MTDLAIHTHGLSKLYGDNVALRNLDLTIARGEIFGLLGHNGAGKTNAVNLSTTLLEPSAGNAAFTWGRINLVTASAVRSRYVAASRGADAGGGQAPEARRRPPLDG
jgi:ABC-type multidrug transport system ATPase subunit